MVQSKASVVLPGSLLPGSLLPWTLVLLLSAGGAAVLVDREPPATTLAVGTDPELARRVGELESEVASLRDQVTTAPGRRAFEAIPVGNVSRIDLESRLIETAERASRAVVCIDSGRQSGSGVVIGRDGHILTNYHVVGSEATVRVQLANGSRYTGRVLGRDECSDVACVRIDARNLEALELGDSDELQVGQVVAALGNPFAISSDGSPSVSLGIVSALHRVIPMSGGREYRDAIQTDAAINPGNSGGALVDLEGRLVGINGAITTRTGVNSGVAFAIPANYLRCILASLKDNRTVEPGFLGIQVTDGTTGAAGRALRGALVNSVAPDSPAHAAGLREDDVILRFQSRPVEGSTRLLNLLSYHQPGEWVELEVWRDGRLWTVSAQVGKRGK